MKILRCALPVFIAITISAYLSPSTCRADGFRNPPASAGGLGVAGNSLAFGEGASALFHNPANLLFSSEAEVEAGLVFARLETEFKSLRGSETSDADWQILPNLYAVYPLDENVSTGLSVTFPYGQSVDWDRDGVFKYLAPYHAEMSMVDVGPTIACRIRDSLLIGAGLDIYSSDLEIKQAYRWANVLPGAPDGDARLEGDAEGFGANLGVTWLMTESQRLAFRYRSAVSLDYDGSARVSNLPPPLAPLFETSSHFSTELNFPEQFAAAYGIELGDRLKIEFNLEHLLWSEMDEQTIDLGVRNTALLGPMESIPYKWDDTWCYGVGGTFSFGPNLDARLGYQFVESPVQDQALSPSLPDSDRHVVGLGVGYSRSGHSLDLAWDISIMDDRRIENNLNPAFNGEYEFNADLFGLSYSYVF